MVEPQASVERLERLTGTLRRRGLSFRIRDPWGCQRLYDFDRSAAGSAPRYSPWGITGLAKAMWSKFRALRLRHLPFWWRVGTWLNSAIS